MDGRSISREMAMRIADRELGPSSREIKIIKYVHHLESRLAAADRLAEAVGPTTHLVGDGWSWGVTLSPEKRDRILKTLADYQNTKKGEP